MSWIKKKVVYIFSDGSLNFGKIIFRKPKRTQIKNTDHLTFSFNKKNLKILLNSRFSKNFKRNYLKI